MAQHLVMVANLLDTDIEAAEAHAETAVRRAGRVPAAREALGLVAYRKGEWAKALSEFRTARRLSGSSHMLPLMVDAERGLGRLDRALDLAASPEASSLPLDERIELAIVVSGIRRDLGQLEAAAVGLEIPQLRSTGAPKTWSARLFYAYAEARLALGDTEGARDWFARAVDADVDGQTDADDRLAELDGVSLTDLLDGLDEEVVQEPPADAHTEHSQTENPDAEHSQTENPDAEHSQTENPHTQVSVVRRRPALDFDDGMHAGERGALGHDRSDDTGAGHQS